MNKHAKHEFTLELKYSFRFHLSLFSLSNLLILAPKKLKSHQLNSPYKRKMGQS